MARAASRSRLASRRAEPVPDGHDPLTGQVHARDTLAHGDGETRRRQP
jgi:hypothetical protein